MDVDDDSGGVVSKAPMEEENTEVWLWYEH
jgi:hypothetical protein